MITMLYYYIIPTVTNWIWPEHRMLEPTRITVGNGLLPCAATPLAAFAGSLRAAAAQVGVVLE